MILWVYGWSSGLWLCVCLDVVAFSRTGAEADPDWTSQNGNQDVSLLTPWWHPTPVVVEAATPWTSPRCVVVSSVLCGTFCPSYFRFHRAILVCIRCGAQTTASVWCTVARDGSFYPKKKCAYSTVAVTVCRFLVLPLWRVICITISGRFYASCVWLSSVKVFASVSVLFRQNKRALDLTFQVEIHEWKYRPVW